jgi:hypothetical protein
VPRFSAKLAAVTYRRNHKDKEIQRAPGLRTLKFVNRAPSALCVCVSLWFVTCVTVASFYAQKKPEITVSPTKVKMGDPVQLTGTGFTPNRSVMSHLRRPDGSEYNPLRFRTTERGEFSHKIDTVMLDVGTFELWAEDEASKVISNRIQFNVE